VKGCALKLLAAAAGLLAAGAGRSETLMTSLSSDHIAITSNFTGADLALFGAVERDPASGPRAINYDVVVTVRGPRGAVTVREKKRIGPFWINADQRKYIAIPSFIEVLANRPLDEIASASLRAELHFGAEMLVPAQAAKDRLVDEAEPDFRVALIRLRTRQHLFREVVPGVQFFDPKLFRAVVHVPGIVPLGPYDVDVALLADGALLARSTQRFIVTKSGVEATLAAAARERPILYGLSTASLAVLIGWLATVIFRRD